jgi:membrane protein DedA with SNARE-associated domain
MNNLPSFIQSLSPFIHNNGYLGIAGFVFLEDFGVPVPGETILITGAVFAGLGQLNVILVGLSGFIAAVLGDNVGFAIGRYGGHPLIERFGKYLLLTKERVAKAESAFKKRGGLVVIVARFIEGLRQANGIMAGLIEMPWVNFLVFNMIGAALWVILWTSIGYFGANQLKYFIHYDVYLSLLALIVIIAYLVYRFHFKNKK